MFLQQLLRGLREELTILQNAQAFAHDRQFGQWLWEAAQSFVAVTESAADFAWLWRDIDCRHELPEV